MHSRAIETLGRHRDHDESSVLRLKTDSAGASEPCRLCRSLQKLLAVDLSGLYENVLAGAGSGGIAQLLLFRSERGGNRL